MAPTDQNGRYDKASNLSMSHKTRRVTAVVNMLNLSLFVVQIEVLVVITLEKVCVMECSVNY